MLKMSAVTLKAPVNGLIAAKAELQGAIRFLDDDPFQSVQVADNGAYRLNAWKDKEGTSKCADVTALNRSEGREYPFTCSVVNGHIMPIKIRLDDYTSEITLPIAGYRVYKISDDFYYIPPQFVNVEEKVPPSGNKTVKLDMRLERDILTPGTSEKIHYMINNNSDFDILSTTLYFLRVTKHGDQNDCVEPCQTAMKLTSREQKILAGAQKVKVTEEFFIPADLKHTKIDKENYLRYELHLEVVLPLMSFKARTPVLIGGQEDFERKGNVEFNLQEKK